MRGGNGMVATAFSLRTNGRRIGLGRVRLFTFSSV